MSTTDILSSSTCVCQVRGGIDPIRSAFGTYAGGLANSLPPKIFRKTIEAFVRTFLIIDNPVRCAYRLRTREVTHGGCSHERLQAVSLRLSRLVEDFFDSMPGFER